MKPEFLNSQEKARILRKLEIFGIKKVPFLLLKSGRDKIRAYSGNFRIEELQDLSEKIFVELIGVYFARFDGDDLRLSLDALHLLKEQITENIIEISSEQFEDYIRGKDIDLNDEQKKLFGDKKGYFVLRFRDDFIGMTKVVNEKFIKNYLPKERRRK